MDKTFYDEWKETREILENVTRSLEKTLDNAEYLQRTGHEYVSRYNDSETSASTGSCSEEFHDAKQNIDNNRPEEWRKLLFERNYPVELENEPRWYKVLQRYRPSRSLYDGFGEHTPRQVVKMDASVQTDLTFVRKVFVLGMESQTMEKEEKRSGIYGNFVAAGDSRELRM